MTFNIGDRVKYTGNYALMIRYEGETATVTWVEATTGNLSIRFDKQREEEPAWCVKPGAVELINAPSTPPAALDTQVGGGHYKDMAIQPLVYIMANKLTFAEGSVVKYVSRWRKKGGVEDLKKAKHLLSVLIEDAEKAQG